MQLLPLIAAIIATSTRTISSVTGFSILPSPRSTSPQTKLHATTPHNDNKDGSSSNIPNKKIMMQRRTLLSNLIAASCTIPFLLAPSITNAASIPSITSADFDIILKDSAKSILNVELSGPKSETAIVKLVDGTTFNISDLIESSTDPRSPLKLVARCRLFNITVKNTGLASAVSGDGSIVSTSGKKKKNFANPRVQKAEKLNEIARERMAQDERERLEELYKYEGKQAGFLSSE